ncbi:MAG: HD domain-containing protein [Deltaproteobacteria bacterium]|nr:HD domain-containing protein [Deltaproteobacteria bacterium]
MSVENNARSQVSEMEFVKAFYKLIYTARLHKDNNKLLRDCLEKFKKITDSMTGEGDLKLQAWRGRFYFNGEKLIHGRDVSNLINEMIKYFSARDTGGFHFFVTSRDATPQGIMTFIRLVDISVKSKKPFDWLNTKLKEYKLSWVHILEKQDDDRDASISGPGAKRQERAKNAYLLALDTVKEVADKASKGVAGVLKARRLAQNIVDLIHEDSSLILGLATLHEYDDYTYTHSVNVSLLATCLGKKIGLSKIALEHLSVCGLFHDLGKVGVPREILLKQGELNDEEWKQMQDHPLLGVKKILRLNADKELRSKIILGPFEHHLNPDMTGYPKTHFMKKLSLTGKILRIADVYEALTADRKYRSRAFTPDEALRKMWSEGARSFDMILLKSFIGMMGPYPIGSIVELNNGRYAMVTDYPKGHLASPAVALIEEDSIGVMSRGEIINLANNNDTDNHSRLDILKGILPSHIGVSIAELLLSE